MWLFKDKTPEPTHPLVRAQEAIVELNAAMQELQSGDLHRHLRAYVTSYDPRTRTKGKVVLGYWNSLDRQFIIVFDGN